MKKIITIIIVVICSLPLFSTTVIVAQNGNGDYTTIQAAVNGVSSGDTIWVAPGTYYESIEINTSLITLKSNDPELCIISSPNESHCIEINSGINKIEGFTIKNASNSALVTSSQLIELNNCIFENNESYAPNHGSAITAYRPFEELTECIFKNNTGLHTVLISCDYSSNPTVYENITNNVFINNTNTAPYPVSGKDLSLMNASQNYHGIIDRNTFKGDTGGIFLKADLWNNADLLISNCIFDEAEITDNDIFEPAHVSISYSCFSGNGYQNNYTWLSGNMTNTEPDVDSSGELIWDEDNKSPCIDTGDPSITDPDGTPSDMGAVRAITHRYDHIELPSPEEDNNGLKWLSFPSLDVVLDEADIAGNVLEDILDPTILDSVIAEDYVIYWYFNQWYNINEQFQRTEGFKFKMNDAATLEVPGFKEHDNSTIVLEGNSDPNWIGYWLDETQSVEDAFSEYWNGENITMIKSQYWTAVKYMGTWWYKVSHGHEPTLSYGDMVIVTCNTTINDFSWDNSTPEDPKVSFSEPKHYTYEEQEDYVPLYVEIDPTDPPIEIGAKINGECIGATVVEDTLTQISAYVSGVNPGDIELELYYGERAKPRTLTSYKCTSVNEPDIIKTKISTQGMDEAYFITLRDDSNLIQEINDLSASNYPNPFNPSTTIAYSLANDGKINLKVYNIKGQLVKTLVKGEQLAGNYETVWDGRDKNEKSVSSGVYFYKLSTKDETILKKMMLLK